MTTYTVHVYRKLRLTFPGIEAESSVAAAATAARRSLYLAHEVRDCPHANFGALVDLESADDDSQRADVPFEAGRLLDAASDLLAALELAVTALNRAPRFRVPSLDTDSYEIAAVCDRAILKAKWGAQ